MLIPRQKTPSLKVPTLSHGDFDLGKESNQRGIIICVYRGLHCPVCAKYLTELDARVEAFAERGVGTIAISSDGKDRAGEMADKISAKNLRIGYDLDLKSAREWGLYISTSRGKTSIGIEEPALFAEPGVFMITPEQTLYYGYVQTMPFARPNFAELLTSMDFAIANDYPARGEYTGEL